ncbi:MAG TPA: glycosyl hydrolase family 28-related protein [Candidatus Koribacter sp.]|jgi:parallel beta-helix repeat protein
MKMLRLALTILPASFLLSCAGTSPFVPAVHLNAAGDDVVNVRDFGARGDGSTDDTAALIAAVNQINSLGNASSALYFAPGTYVINPLYGMKPHFGLLLTASNVEIYGDRATIALDSRGKPYDQQLNVPANTTFYWNYFEVRGSHVNVHDLTFDSRSMTTTGGYRGTNGMFWASALDINGTPNTMQSDNTVHNNRFVSLGGWAVNGSYENNLVIDRNYANHSEGMGCGGQVYGCTITNNVSENGLDAHYFSNGYTHAGSQNQNVLISGNIAEGNSNGSGIDVTASWDTVVENNTVSANANWCILVGKTWGPYKQDGPILPSQRVTVKNNTCTKNGWYQGWPMNSEIFVGEQYAENWNPGDVASDITVQANTVSSQNAQGRGVVVGYGTARVTIDNNELSGCASACIAPVIRIAETGTDTLSVTNNHQDKQFATTYIYLGKIGPYTVSGNDMLVHQ